MKTKKMEIIEFIEKNVGLTPASKANLEEYLYETVTARLADGTEIKGQVIDVRTESDGQPSIIWVETEVDIYEIRFEYLLEKQQQEKLENGTKKEFCSTIDREANEYFGQAETRLREYLIHVKSQHDMNMVEKFFKSKGFSVSCWGDGFDGYMGYVSIFMEDGYESVADFKDDVNTFYKIMKKELK